MPHEAKSELVDIVDDITGYSKRTRKLVIMVIIGLIIDITLTVVIGLLFNTLHNNQVQACLASDSAKIKATSLWESEINTVLPSPSQASQRDALLTQVHLTYALVNCGLSCESYS